MVAAISKYRDRFRQSPQGRLNFGELAIDNFAGGGGASTGIEEAMGRPVDIAINHDPGAVAMHEVNHPTTKHYCESVWEVDPRQACGGRPVGLAWFSPDCKHFSRAKGKTPVDKKIRGLAWVVIRWAATVRPRVIMLENVPEFLDWGPLVKDTAGDLRPCPERKGITFASFVGALRRQGYEVEWRELRACDYGAPTIRKRLFLVARRDGQPIAWPEPSHGDPASEAVRNNRLLPWRTAADCIDWNIPCPSIFERKKPLAEATMQRIAKGIERYVINSGEPFIVPISHYSKGRARVHSGRVPLPTVTAWPRGGDLALVAPFISTYYGAKKSIGETRGAKLSQPIATQTTENRHALVTAFLAKHYTGVVGSEINAPIGTVTGIDHHSMVTANIVRQFGHSVGSKASEPVGTITSGGDGKTLLATSHLVKLRGSCKDGQALTAPLPTLTAGGNHVGEVRAFLLKYNGSEQDPKLGDPLHTITTRDRFGLVTVRGQEYQIVDIGLRMLSPRELFRAQGFPENYIIGRDCHGRPITKTAQVMRVGNSVCPPVVTALVQANMAVATEHFHMGMR